ncbi:DNA polymerase thumb domain-containing protein [Priestia koreensis]|uniref:DinB/UmuC family translesion DNA polymerase n=1 Tax=Priestia koreensis TaxID=284581 RepID=UPI00203C141F|nr:DNA repair protein [Priestia koreensis]MCM3005875.1 DNA repair protein [Priestia koreensis]
MYDYSQFPDHKVMAIDAKSFFASVACLTQLGTPHDPLTTKLAVVSDLSREWSVVLAASPALKKEFPRIKTGSRHGEIPKRKDIHIVESAMSTYIKYSNMVTNVLLDYVAPQDLYAYSVDENFIQLKSYSNYFKVDLTTLAERVQADIRTRTGIPVTIGIGPNPLIAKLCLDLKAKHSPTGIEHWHYEDLPTKLWPLRRLSDMWGIAKKTEAKLHQLGIYSVGALAKYPMKYLVQHFGKVKGEELHLHAWGIDFSRLDERYVPHSTSISESQILMRDYTRIEEIQTILLEQCENLAFRALRTKKVARTIHLTIQYSHSGDGNGFSRQMQLDTETNFTKEIYDACVELFHRHYTGEPVRVIGVSLKNLVSDDERQLDLFEDEAEREKRYRLATVIDQIRQKHGKNSLLRGSSYFQHATARERNGKLGGHKA